MTRICSPVFVVWGPLAPQGVNSYLFLVPSQVIEKGQGLFLTTALLLSNGF